MKQALTHTEGFQDYKNLWQAELMGYFVFRYTFPLSSLLDVLRQIRQVTFLIRINRKPANICLKQSGYNYAPTLWAPLKLGPH